jgi:hypothetical protein
MLVERKKKRDKKKKKNSPGAQTTSDVVWAHLLHEVSVAVVARSVGRVWMGVKVGGSSGVETRREWW